MNNKELAIKIVEELINKWGLEKSQVENFVILGWDGKELWGWRRVDQILPQDGEWIFISDGYQTITCQYDSRKISAEQWKGCEHSTAQLKGGWGGPKYWIPFPKPPKV